MKTIDELLAELRKRDPGVVFGFTLLNPTCVNPEHCVGCCIVISIAAGREVEIETCGVSCVDALTNAIAVIDTQYPLAKSN